MTWWGALGLALALYGVVVLLEWLYDQIVGSHGPTMPAISVVVRIANQENHVEQTVRDLESLIQERSLEDQRLEVILWPMASSDQTEAILERLTRPTGFKVVEASDAETVLTFCHHPFVIWLDVSDANRSRELLGGLRRVVSVAK